MNWISRLGVLDPGKASGALLWALVVGMAAWGFSSLLTRLLKHSTSAEGKPGCKIDQTMLRYVIHMKTIIVFVAASLVYASIIPHLRALFGTLVASAGVSALVIGFAAKSTLANLISGMAMAVYRPFRIGDKVTIEGEYGEIEDITLRHTILRTWEHKRLVIPNEKLDNMSVMNYTIVDRRMLCPTEIRVSYDTDLGLAKRVFLAEAMRCPYRDQEKEEEPWARVVEHEDSGVLIRVYMWVPDVDAARQGRFWLLESIKTACTREGIEIPVPYRAVVYKNDLPPPRRDDSVVDAAAEV